MTVPLLRSVEEPDRFWPEHIDDRGIEFSQPWTSVVDESLAPSGQRGSTADA